jgi:hypothetical protein
MNALRPYLGITGFTRRSEVEAVLATLPPRALAQRDLMVGVLLSDKLLAGKVNKYPLRYPPLIGIPEIFTEQSECLNLLHYHTTRPDTLAEQLIWGTEIAGPHCQGAQLNQAWPEVRQVERYAAFLQCHTRTSGRTPRIILQLGRKAQQELAQDPVLLARAVYDYQGCVTDVLIDPSGGLGKSFEAEKALPLLEAIHVTCPQLGLGLAGGLCQENLPALNPLLPHFPSLSIDAEGRLRDPESDQLSLTEAVSYLKRALTLFSPSHPAPVN